MSGWTPDRTLGFVGALALLARLLLGPAPDPLLGTILVVALLGFVATTRPR